MKAIQTLPLVFLYVFISSIVVSSANAQSYPTKPIRMIVAVAPGGTSDFLARILAVKMSEHLGVPVVVDNRPGASGVIAMDIVAKATPDGHTIGVQSLMHIVNPSLYAKMPTIAKSGVPGFEIAEWWGIFAPAGLPADILRKLNTEIVKVLALPDVKERSDKIGLELVGDRPEQFDAFLRTELVKWANVVKQARVKLD